MENQEIISKIENLNGRRNYEEKRAAKLGFSSLYEYFEDKFKKQALEVEKKETRLIQFQADKELIRKSKNQKKKSCGCC
ncbi:MAG: hypothetical protein P8J85_14280 [Alphaproteobacteria bacterium]|nr:hypothetical protein [Alphaproteobacteria bacterium]|tara:strand:+ start:470 stop:706 length:237 start_codon:yes stop_codon:yes gene_type:complete